MPCASSSATVAALIMPRSATMQARRMPNRVRRRSITGNSVGDIGGVTGPEEGGDRPVVAIQHDATYHLVQLRTESPWRSPADRA